MVEPTRAQATEAVERELVTLLRRVRARVEQRSRELHADLDVAAYSILGTIDAGRATTVTELAERLAVGKPTVSRQVTALEQLGLLRRTPAAGDRRAVILELTSDGHARLSAARVRRREQLTALLMEWSIDDVSALGELLGRFNQLDW